MPILLGNPKYGLNMVGFVDDGPYCPADAWAPGWASWTISRSVLRNRPTVLLIADGHLQEADCWTRCGLPACLPCDVLVVPRMHHFHTQTGLPDHIGSIPIMRIQTPRLGWPAWSSVASTCWRPAPPWSRWVPC